MFKYDALNARFPKETETLLFRLSQGDKEVVGIEDEISSSRLPIP